MTEQEAIAYLKPRLRLFIQCTDDNIALNKAMSALDKQIPKKPKKYYYCDSEAVGCDCPTCGEPLYMGLFCHECGQKIDWSGE